MNTVWNRSSLLRTLLSAVCILMMTPLLLFAQFGKNKVRYDDYNWSYIQTQHFDLYFHEDGEELAHAGDEGQFFDFAGL